MGWAPPPPPRRRVWPIVVFAGLGGFGLGVAITIGVVALLTFSDFGTHTGNEYDESSAAATAEPGDCFSRRDLKPSEVATVDCDDSHAFEVYARHPALSGDDVPYPTEDFELMADGVCVEEFKAYVSNSYFASGLEYTILIPSREAWTAGERDIVCGLYDMDEDPLVGTSKGSGR